MFAAYLFLKEVGKFETFEDAFRALHPLILKEIKDETPVTVVATTTFITENGGFMPGDISNQWGNMIERARTEGLLDGDNLVPKKTSKKTITVSRPKGQTFTVLGNFHA